MQREVLLCIDPNNGSLRLDRNHIRRKTRAPSAVVDASAMNKDKSRSLGFQDVSGSHDKRKGEDVASAARHADAQTPAPQQDDVHVVGGGKEKIASPLLSSPIECKHCGDPIRDRYVYRVDDALWHGACIRCRDCGVPLAEKCFARDNRLYCRNDFFRRFGVKCVLCGVGVAPTTFVHRAAGHVYHVDCFRCLVCNRQLVAGNFYYSISNGKVVCKKDLDKAKEIEGLAKRPRTNISSEQQKVLWTAYRKTPKPSRQTRDDLAASTGLPQRVVQVWFQNRRAKEKRTTKGVEAPVTNAKALNKRSAKGGRRKKKTLEVKSRSEASKSFLLSADEVGVQPPPPDHPLPDHSRGTYRSQQSVDTMAHPGSLIPDLSIDAVAMTDSTPAFPYSDISLESLTVDHSLALTPHSRYSDVNLQQTGRLRRDEGGDRSNNSSSTTSTSTTSSTSSSP